MGALEGELVVLLEEVGAGESVTLDVTAGFAVAPPLWACEST